MEINSLKNISKYLAKFTNKLTKTLYQNYDDPNFSFLKDLNNSFKKYLNQKIAKLDFCESISQILIYGLFITQFYFDEPFKSQDLLQKLSKYIPFLKEFFQDLIKSPITRDLDKNIDDLAIILENTADNFTLFEKDPFIYSYEYFLEQLNPSIRKAHGVYYTPPEVVNFMVNSLEILLRQKFRTLISNIPKIRILDPAVGTGTFLSEIMKSFIQKETDKLKKNFVVDWIFSNLYGFEISISSYIIAQFRLRLLIKSLINNDFSNEKLKIYLTDTIDDSFVEVDPESIMEKKILNEYHKVSKVKHDTKINVIIGNPPYSKTSKRRGNLYHQLEIDYLTGLGVENEIKKGVLKDVYIRFIKFAQNKIEGQNQTGIIVYITNNSYLDGIIHRRMRQSLLETFDEIYIVNLHGNRRRGEQDENIFDIQQGVAISFFVKINPGRHKFSLCKLNYFSTFTNNLKSKKEKAKFLKSNNLKSIKNRFETVNIEKFESFLANTRWYTGLTKRFKTKNFGFYYFITKAIQDIDEYGNGYGLKEIFQISSSGIETKYDKMTLFFSKTELKNFIQDIQILSVKALEEKYEIKDRKGWNLKKIQEDIKKDLEGLASQSPKKLIDERIQRIHYRPFDIRFTYFFDKSSSFLGRPRYEVMKNLIPKDDIEQNISIISTRQVNEKFNHVFISELISERIILSAQSKEHAFVFPLYVYQIDKNYSIKRGVKHNPIIKKSNIDKNFLKICKERYGSSVSDKDILYYIYGLLNSKFYKNKFASFLKIDFPRIPLYSDKKFKKLHFYGKQLANLHLKKEETNVNIKKTFFGTNLRIERIRYIHNKLFINEQAFFKVPVDVWKFKIGTYQVLRKYLRYRIGNKQTREEIKEICIIIKIILKTIQLYQKL